MCESVQYLDQFAQIASVNDEMIELTNDAVIVHLCFNVVEIYVLEVLFQKEGNNALFFMEINYKFK